MSQRQDGVAGMIDLPQVVFNRLTAQQLALFNAMNNKLRARHWMGEARKSNNLVMRTLYTSFARCAHHCYRQDMNRAVRYAQERL